MKGIFRFKIQVEKRQPKRKYAFKIISLAAIIGILGQNWLFLAGAMTTEQSSLAIVNDVETEQVDSLNSIDKEASGVDLDKADARSEDGKDIETEETGHEATTLRFSAVNPGYTDATKVAQNYDFIELTKNSNEALGLEDYWIEYTNSTGKVMEPFTFPEGAVLETASVVLGFDKSPQYKTANSLYLYNFGSSAGLASTSGRLRLYLADKVVDEVCWGKTSCEEKWDKFASSEEDNFSMQRKMVAEEGCDISNDACKEVVLWQAEKYYPEIDELAIVIVQSGEPSPMPQCMGVTFTEIYSYFENDYTEQFVELFNSGDEIVNLSGCKIVYKNQTFELSGELYPEHYLAYRNLDLKLTKNPSSQNTISLVDVDGSIVSELTYYKGQKKGASYALVETQAGAMASWQISYHVTPGLENVFQEFRSCPAGKIINPATGNCINISEDEPLPECPPGKYRNPLTNRCKSYDTISNILAPCPDGYYRNPETNRCKKAVSEEDALKPCPDGYERNPETNRCRKIRVNDGADYAVKPMIENNEKAFIAYGVLMALVLLGLAYIIFQFRHEIKNGISKIFKRKH